MTDSRQTMSDPGADGTGFAALCERLLAGDLGFVPAFDLGALTTYRVGGAAAVGVEVTDEAHLERVAMVLAELHGGGAVPPVVVIGRGSNLLVADGVVPCIALRLGEHFEQVEFEQVEFEQTSSGQTSSGQASSGWQRVHAGAAASLPVVARRTVAEGLTGFEWAVGVPGTIGGAVRMNAGGHGSDMAASVETVRVVDLESGKDLTMRADDCEFGYRRSSIAAHQVVTSATLRLAVRPAGDLSGDLSDDGSGAGERELAEIVRWRRHHQPGGQNAGSVFTNPPGDSAGRLIDVAGCKGRRIGSASVSAKHANFIQADPRGSAADVAALMASVRAAVLEHSGVELHAETIMIGFTAEVVAAAGAR